MPISSASHPEILLVLGAEWMTAREVHAKLGMWSPVSVKHMLNTLAREGTIETETRPLKGQNTIRYYRNGRGT